MTNRTARMPWVPLAAIGLLGACAEPAATAPPAAASYSRVPAAVAENDTNVYQFEHEGPNRLGTVAVTARATAGPGAAPNGTLAGAAGRARAEAAAAFYAQNRICAGAPFRLAGEEVSRYEAAENSWTVFGRCTGA